MSTSDYQQTPWVAGLQGRESGMTRSVCRTVGRLDCSKWIYWFFADHIQVQEVGTVFARTISLLPFVRTINLEASLIYDTEIWKGPIFHIANPRLQHVSTHHGAIPMSRELECPISHQWSHMNFEVWASTDCTEQVLSSLCYNLIFASMENKLFSK